MYRIRLVGMIIGLFAVSVTANLALAHQLDGRSPSFQQAPATVEVPLVIIHFSGGDVDFHEKVIHATQEAQAIKPEVFVDIVSIFNHEVDCDDEAYQHILDCAEAVADAVLSAGIPSTNVRITYQADRVFYNEVQIFVR